MKHSWKEKHRLIFKMAKGLQADKYKLKMAE